MIALGPREIGKALALTLALSTALHLAQQVIAGLVALQMGAMP